MVKFRKKTHRKLNKKSKRSIKGGAQYHCFEGPRESPRQHPRRRKRNRARKTAAASTLPLLNLDPPTNTRRPFPDAVVGFGDPPGAQLRPGSPFDEEIVLEPPTLESAVNTPQRVKRVDSKQTPERGGGSRTKRKRKNKKKNTRKARGIIDDLRTLCTTGRCGSPRPQTPTLRELALNIEQDIIDDYTKNKPEIALTSKQRRNIKAVANDEAARIVNTSSSASKKNKKKKKRNL